MSKPSRSAATTVYSQPEKIGLPSQDQIDRQGRSYYRIGEASFYMAKSPFRTWRSYRDMQSVVFVSGELFSADRVEGTFQTAELRTPEKVIHRLWRQKGVNWSKGVDGAFAVVIADIETGRVTAYRDPMGIKPLYYRWQGETLEFSSDIASLVRSGEPVPRLLPPGSVLDGVDVFPYFALGEERSSGSSVLLRSLLETAVARRAALSESLGACLSGGLDSSLITEILAAQGAKPIVYTVETEGSLDGKRAAAIAESRELDHRRIRVGIQEVEEALPHVIRLVETYDRVVVENALVNYFTFREAARDGLTAIFCGQGADDIFGSYPFFRHMPSEELEESQRFYLENTHRFDVQRVERIAAAFGLNVRLPYLDPRVVNYCLNLPPHHKRRTVAGRFVDKYLLRQVACTLSKRERLRQKEVMCESSGVGLLLSELAAARYTDSDVQISKKVARDWPITSKEAILSFHVWRRLFPAVYQAGFAPFETLGKASPFHIGYQ